MNGSPTRGRPYQNGYPANESPTKIGSSYSNGHVSPTQNGSPTKSPVRSRSTSPSKRTSPIQVAPVSAVDEEQQKPGILQRFSNAIISTMETFFYKLGKSIGTHPIKYIIVCFVVTAICGLCVGFLFTETTETNKLWSASDSEVIKNLEQVEQWFPSTTRFATLMVTENNILTPQVLQKMFTYYNKSINIETSDGYKLMNVCVTAGPNCLVNSILELWSYNEATIFGLSQQDILDTINTVTVSPMYLNAYDVTTALAEIKRNSTGSIIKSTSTKITYLLQGSDSMKDKSMAWEAKFIELSQSEKGLSSVYFFATRSFGDEGGGAITGDVSLLSAGYFVLIIYVAVVLGRFNQVEQGIYLALSGILCVGMSICVSFGLSSACGLEYGPLHSILPFLLLGIGVDDMFVIIGALNNLNPDEIELEIPEKIGHVLKHAGLSVTVTSITDVVAFGIGATTVLPALKSFCGFAAIGILGLFFFQTIFFTATLALDQRRRGQDRNACCCCYVHKDYTPNKCSQKEILILFFKKFYAPFILKLPVKIVLFILTLAIFGVNVYGVVSLKQEFDSNWFLPTDSYASEYVVNSEKYFPGDGKAGSIYCGNIDYFGSKSKFDQMYTNIKESQYYSNGTLDSWFKSMTDFLLVTSDAAYTAKLDANKYPVDEQAFIDLTHRYVTVDHKRYVRLFSFANSSGGDILASQITFKFKNLPDSKTEIAAMDAFRKIVTDAGFSEQCFVYSRSFLNWETNKVIQTELYRNLGLAFLCVFLVTLVLIANLWTCLMVSCCIMFTLVNVGGSMHFWGLTIETVTSIQLILAIGLAVDYSAHIGHTFMTIKGTRQARALETLSEMGPPVFNGGFSTFLAFVLLGGSNSYVFTTFFKVFFLVVWYGLFHGLVFLPIILSWLGPSPYLSADHIYHEKVPPSGDHVPHHSHTHDNKNMNGINNMAMTSSSKQFPNNGYTNRNGYPPNYDDIETVYIPPPDYTPPTTKKGLPRVAY
ncbi:patched domain-containing protein 3 isoform X1 [Patella vulgata]|uniref:patched domain-containing protein 3 isoform X1 n=1 Tax=Patella vulgata TaxID=6465 RepID=UPI0024A81518|nr:patched domain-containing protein 3 isoform X1 [Patella vulgata]